MQELMLDRPALVDGEGETRRRARPRGEINARFRTAREYLEIVAVIAIVTLLGWFAPFLSYRAWGHIYLLAVVLLCARVGRTAAFFAAVLSAVAWNFVIMPPRLSFSVLNWEDGLTLGTYFVVALIAGQLTATIRAQELRKSQGEQRALALFNLTRGLAAATTLDDAVESALRQADELFAAKTALLIADEGGTLVPHPAGSHPLSRGARTLASWASSARREVGRFTSDFSEAVALYLPMVRDHAVLGVFVVAPAARASFTAEQRDLASTFAAQMALQIERERLRDAGARAKIVAESDRLHRTLLDSVSHELKTPLAVLRAASDNIEAADVSRRAALMREIRMAVHRLDRLVANLLNQTRLEAGAVRPQVAPCDVRDLIAAARRTVGGPLDRRAIELEIHADVPLVRADAPLMEHVLGNLLLNAAIYSPAETAIEVAAGVAADGRVFVRVADRGPGIPEELRAHLFEKFRRGNEAAAGGAGLGLAIVRGFMLAQSGEVVARNRPDGGAEFTVFLPACAHEEVPE